jgi:hypothetical protein
VRRQRCGAGVGGEEESVSLGYCPATGAVKDAPAVICEPHDGPAGRSLTCSGVSALLPPLYGVFDASFRGGSSNARLRPA